MANERARRTRLGRLSHAFLRFARGKRGLHQFDQLGRSAYSKRKVFEVAAVYRDHRKFAGVRVSDAVELGPYVFFNSREHRGLDRVADVVCTDGAAINCKSYVEHAGPLFIAARYTVQAYMSRVR